jgi:hypothetical protein
MPEVTGPLAGEPRQRLRDTPLTRRAGSWLMWWIMMMAFWIVIDDSVNTDELLAGSGAAALAALLAEPAIALIPGIGAVFQAAAIRFQDQPGYNATVLTGAHVAHPVALMAAEPTGITVSGVLTSAGSAAGALILAAAALYWRRLPLLRRGYEPGAGLTAPIKRFQSGVVNDYVTWIVLGLACLGGVLALIVR